MLAITGVIVLTGFLMSSDIEENSTPISGVTEVKQKKEIVEDASSSKEKSVEQNTKERERKISYVVGTSSFIPNSISELFSHSERTIDLVVPKKKAEKHEQTTEFVFPKLTKNEISENNRRKKKMLKALNKKDKKVYSYIPSGSFTFQSKTVSVQAFHMQRTEVTNVEYKTFLFDLLIQGRKNDFLVAKPKQELWAQELGDDYAYMQDEYFSGEEYEDHPVNNISRKGAEMYCDWITREANKINKSNGKVLINDVRIPMRVEWLKAATEEGKRQEYTWEGDKLFPICLMSNFSMTGFSPITATMNRTGLQVPFGDSTAISTGGYLFGKRHVLVKSKCYNVSDLGLYNVCGNVAEMVYDLLDPATSMKRSNMNPGTAGGGWMNTQEEIKLSAEDKYEGVVDEHLNIGFRVVITYFNPSK